VTIPCDLLITSVGYKGLPLSPSLPFDDSSGTLDHENGRVNGLTGVYGAGWIKRGAKGIVGTNVEDGREVARRIMEDYDAGLFVGAASDKDDDSNSTPMTMESLLKSKNIGWVDWEGWRRIDAYETNSENKRCASQPREKIVDADKMKKVAQGNL